MLRRSEDGGVTWTTVLSVTHSAGITSVAFDPQDPIGVRRQHRRFSQWRWKNLPFSEWRRYLDAAQSPFYHAYGVGTAATGR